MEIATYRILPEQNGKGTFFITDCGHKMYSVKNEMAYHGKLCPGCFWKNKKTVLYIRGSEEANKYWDEKLKKGVI